MPSVYQAQTQYNALLNSAPQHKDYYNQSFVDRIAAAQQNIANLVAEKDKAYSTANRARDEYDSFTGNMRSYADVYAENEDEFGVKQAQGDYEKTKSALAMTESVLEALPSSISARSGRVLTQEQRNLAYNAQADIINRTQSNLTSAANTYEQAWKNARENQAAKTQAEMAIQRQNQQTLNSVWTGELDNFNRLQQNVAKSRLELLQEENAYRTWQDQQWQNDYNMWTVQLNAAGQRLAQAQKNAYEPSATLSSYLPSQSSTQSPREGYYSEGEATSDGAPGLYQTALFLVNPIIATATGVFSNIGKAVGSMLR